MFTQSRWAEENMLRNAFEGLGLGLIAVAVVGRAWCSLYIGGRKKEQIVDIGPYSVSRNPLYLCNFIGAFGVGALTGSLTIALAVTAAAVALFVPVIRKEEAWLTAKFGNAYVSYAERTPRFGPDPGKWRDRPTILVNPVYFMRTIRDGSLIFIAWPAIEVIGMIQDEGWIDAIVQLP